MIIKTADDKNPDIRALEMLLTRRDLTPAAATDIRQEIRNINAGSKNERDAAYQIDFYLRDNENVMAVHDLRIEYAGRVAQIDHLVMNRGCDIWVCESKSFSEGVSINEYGEWSSYFGGRARGLASPIEQNRRHMRVLQDIFDSGLVPLPKRLGITIKPCTASSWCRVLLGLHARSAADRSTALTQSSSAINC